MSDAPPPRWFALLPVLAIAAWWPIAPYWQSDDFLALHYSQSLTRALSDFVGPQYGATDIWLFYRPLITLSFWFDQLIAGSDPFFSHLSNVLAHGVSALLVALIWRRFLPASRAFGAGLLWALMPGHVGSIAWGVGRVDSHTVVWCLLAGWLLLRQCERAQRSPDGRTARWPALLALATALASKELAFIVPPACTLLAFCVARGSFGSRARFALRESLSTWLVFAGYLGVRFLVLGRFGGYLGATYEPMAMASGLLTYCGNLLVPLRWVAGGAALGEGSGTIAVVIAAACLLPAGVTALLRPHRTTAAILMFLGTAAPVSAFFVSAENVHNLRYFYLPTVALAGLLAGPGLWSAVLVALTFAVPLVAMRAEQLDADRESAAMHAALLQTADGLPAAPPEEPHRLFVAGLPHSNPRGSVVQLHFAVDRMLQPPFHDPGGPELYALRPLDASGDPTAFRPWPKRAPRALPGARNLTYAFAPDDPTRLEPIAAAPSDLPDLPFGGDLEAGDLENGVLDVSTARLHAATARYPGIFENREPSFGLTTPGVRPMCYRVTLFTANGWICGVVLDHGLGGENSGSIDMLRFLVNDEHFRPTGAPAFAGRSAALTGPGEARLVALDLLIPTTIDLEPAFPTLIEAGNLDPATFRFTPTHRARRLVLLRFDRNYPSWVRLLQGGS